MEPHTRLSPVRSRDAVAVATATGAKAAAIFVVGAVVARSLGTGALGTFSVAFTAGILGMRLVELGIAAVVVREAARVPARGAALLGGAVRARLVAGVAVVAASTAVGLAIGYRGEALATMALMGGYAAVDALARAFLAATHARGDLVGEAVVTVPAAAGVAVVSVALLTAGAGLAPVAAVFLLGAAGQAVAAGLRASRHTPGWWEAGSWAEVRGLVVTGWPIGLAGLAAALAYRVDTVMVGILAGDRAAGEYAMAANLLAGPNLVVWAILAAAAPTLAVAAGGGRFPAVHRRLLATVGAVGVATLLLVPVGGWLLHVVYGTASPGAVGAVRLLAVAEVAAVVAMGNGAAYTAIGQQRTNLRVLVVGVVGNIALNLVAIPRLGAVGAAWATLATEAAVAAGGSFLLVGRLRALGRRGG